MEQEAQKQQNGQISLSTVKSNWTKAAIKIYPYFVTDEANQAIIELLHLYVARNTKFERYKSDGVNYSLDKGIALLGDIGTGKTVLMRTMRQTLYYLQSPLHFAADDMSSMCNRYQSADKDEKDPLKTVHKHLFVDEFGLEEVERVMRFGNRVVMGDELIRNRHNLFTQSPPYLTHITSNMDMAGLENFYHPRTVDRIREMFNIIWVTGESRRKYAKPIPKVQQEETEQVNEAEARVLYIATLQKNFAIYKKGGKLDLHFPVYDYKFLRKAGLLKFTDKQIETIKSEAKDELLKRKSNSRLKAKNAIDVQSLTRTINRINDGTPSEREEQELTAIGCEIAIRTYYDSITELIIPNA